MKQANLAGALRQMFLALAGFALIGCADGDCPVGDEVGSASGQSVCLVYSEPTDDRPCRSRDAAECESGGSCILDQVCAPTACNGGYCAAACELRTVCIPFD